MIGIFDSGVGGFSTLKKLLEICPEYSFLYLADSLHAPYGGKSAEQIIYYTKKGVDFLFAQGASVVLLACNTACVVALRTLQAEYPHKKILGVVIPTAEQALRSSRYGTIGIVGTTATIESGLFAEEIKKRAEECYVPKEKKSRTTVQIFSKACPLLVPLIEENWEKKPETTMILKKYLLSLKSCHVDTLILGCTHYPFLKKQFSRIMGKNCVIINSGEAQALSFVEYLHRHPEIEMALSKTKNRTYYTTDSPRMLEQKAKKFLGQTIQAQKIMFEA